jgi:hypothetical protein
MLGKQTGCFSLCSHNTTWQKTCVIKCVGVFLTHSNPAINFSANTSCVSLINLFLIQSPWRQHPFPPVEGLDSKPALSPSILDAKRQLKVALPVLLTDQLWVGVPRSLVWWFTP